MEWILALGLVLGITLLGIMYIFKAKTHRTFRLRGRFDFAQFKNRELSKRGVFDRTGWWK